MALLFLDFDGVTHILGNGQFTHVDRFEAVMREFPHVEIVISSSWREEFSLTEIRNFFSADIAARIIDVTPIFADDDVPPETLYTRWEEIKRWLAEHDRESEDWIALDDMPELFDPDCANLVLVDPDLGFNAGTERELRKRLRKTK